MSTLELEHLKHTSSSSNNLTTHSDGSLTLGSLKVDATNNRVGIGTTAPERDLHIKGAAGDPVHLKLEGDPADYARIMFDNGTTDNIGEVRYDFANNAIKFNTNGSYAAQINSDGYVGIGSGISNPSSALHVEGRKNSWPRKLFNARRIC